MKINIKSIFFISLLLILILSLSATSAASADNVTVMDIGHQTDCLKNCNINEVNENYNLMSSESTNLEMDIDNYSDALNIYGEKATDDSYKNSETNKKGLSGSNLKANVITVNHTGDDVKDLEDAISLANPGDIIDLGDYAYQISRFQIDITKNITLQGNGVSTYFNGTGGTATSGCILYMDYLSRGSTIKGIIFNNTQANTNYTEADSLNGWAIDIDGSRNILIENCSFINFNRATNIEFSNDIIIRNSYFTGAATRITNGNGKEYGSKLMSIDFSTNVDVINNIFDGPVLEAVVINGSTNTYVIENTFKNNAYSICLDSYYSDRTFITNNEFYDCGHFEAIGKSGEINFTNLPVITKYYDGDIYVDYNNFYVHNGNLLILAEASSDNSTIEVKSNKVRKMSEDIDPSTVTFVQVLDVTKNLVNVGYIELSSNELLNGMESLVIVDYIWYSEDGDIIIPQKSDLLNISFENIFSGNPLYLNFTLFEQNTNEPINGTLNVTVNNKSYDVSIIDGKGTIMIEDDFVAGKYPIIAKFNGDASHGVTISYDVLTVYSTNTFKNLQTIIDNAKEGSTIYLTGYYESLGEEIKINKTLTLIGRNDGATLDALKLSRVFVITAPNVVLENLIMTHVRRAVYGGAIWMDADNGTVSNCTFIDNSAMSAGAVAWDGNNGVLKDCNFINSTGNYGSGGAIVWSGSNGSISNCSFLNSYGSSGGAISWNGHYGTVDNCSFESSRGYDLDGGAILWGGRNGTLSNSIFTNNFAFFYGGAVKWTGENGTIINSSFLNNYAKNEEECGAGAIRWVGRNGSIINSQFKNNYVKTNISSEIVFGGAIGWEGPDGIIINSSFENNGITADTDMENMFGGAIYWNGTKGKIYSSNFTNNSNENDKGGAIYWKTSNALIDQCIFLENDATFGGGIYSIGENTTILNSIFKHNNALEGSGLFITEGEELYEDEEEDEETGDNSYVFNCTFIENTGRWGALSWDGDYGILNQSIFINNSGENTTAVYWYGYYGTVANCVFDNDFSSYTLTTGFRPPSFENNFWGLNFNSSEEILNSEIINANRKFAAPETWVNISLEGIEFIEEKGIYEYVLSFISSNGSELEKIMGDYPLKVITNGNKIINQTLYDELGEDALSSNLSSEIFTISENKAKIYYLAKLNINDTLNVYNNNNELLASLNISSNLPDIDTHIISEGNYDTSINKTVYLSFKVLDEDEDLVEIGNVQISCDDKAIEDFEFLNGVIRFEKIFDKTGNYSILINYIGENVYQDSSLEINITVRKLVSAIAASEENETIMVHLTIDDKEASDKEIQVTIENETFKISTNENGLASLNLSSYKAGNYTANIKYLGNDDVEACQCNVSISISDKTPIDNSTNDTSPNENGTDTNGTDTNGTDSNSTDTNGTDTNGTDTNGTDTNGTDGNITPSKDIRTVKDLQELIDNAIPGSTLNLGNYDYQNISDVNITKNITIIGDNTTISSAGDGKAIFNIVKLSENGPEQVNIQNIEFKVNNGDVIIQANSDNSTNPMLIDVAKITIANNTIDSASDNLVGESVTVLKLSSERGILAPSNEIIIANNTLISGIKPFEFDVTSAENASNAFIPAGGNTPQRLGTEILCKNMSTVSVDLVADGRIGKYFTFTLVDSNGNPLANKNIAIGFNGKIYNKTTNETGGAKLQINLGSKGVYTFAMSFLGDENYNASFVVAKINVSQQSPKLTTAKKTYKASAKTKSLTVTFKTQAGNPVASKKITFTVNGKTYTAKTNAKGVATVKVSISKKGNYSFTAKFAGDNKYKATSVKSTLVIS